MSLALESPVALRELVELLRSGPRGTLAVAVCDSMPQARELIAMLREQLALNLVEASFGERQRTLFDLLEAYRLRPGDVLCLLDLQQATEGTLRSLDMQRELLAEYQVSAICWVTRSAQRDLAIRAPNFYAFRTLLLDFTESTEPDLSRYLQDLRDATSVIEIRGLQIGRGRAASFPLDDWYLGLHATGRFADGDGDGVHEKQTGAIGRRRGLSPDVAASRQTRLERLLEHRLLLVVGDPGCGKTTFLRWVTLTLSQTCLGQTPDAAERHLGLSDTLFPVFLRAAELDAYLSRLPVQPDISSDRDMAAGLLDYLAWLADENLWGLDREFFERRLREDGCTVLLDGLDELPDAAARRRMVRLIDRAACVFAGSRFVVTSRPAALSDEVRLANWTYAYVEPLADDVVREFLQRWCAAVYPDSPEAARTHTAELQNALSVRPEIRRMARNPVMLTALVVVHWNEKRLPEQRADLYEAILTWLARSREFRPGRPSPQHCLDLLQRLAIGMHDHPAGRQVQILRRWAADAIADAFSPSDERDRRIAAERFLAAEELDSGIIVSRGQEQVQFWHLTFQEYLAARVLAALPEQERNARLLSVEKISRSEWREVILLLAGVLYRQGLESLDGFFASVLDRLASVTSLAVRARGAGLLGAAVHELGVLNYRLADPRYLRLMNEVLAIFDADRCSDVPIRDAIDAADALGHAGDPRFGMPDAESLWVSIPAGSFWMGAQDSSPEERNFDPDASDNESPVHLVHVPGYAISRYPVTIAQYREFLEDGGYENPSCWTAGGYGHFGQPENWDTQLEHPTRPVTCVSWYEAKAYCCWAGCRLPSEADWERAARGHDGRRYPWGDAPPDATRMNYGWLIRSPTPVGVYPLGLSPLGVADLAGNVWEWCEDAYRLYTQHGLQRSAPTGAQIERVVRGGSWHDQATNCRVSSRNPLSPDYRDVDVGFRTVRILPEYHGGSQ